MNEQQAEKDKVYNLRLLTVWLVYVTFNSALRKWILTDSAVGQSLLGLQIIAPVIFTVLARTKPLTKSIGTVVAGYSIILIIMAFNPLTNNVLIGVIGYFLHIGVFVPLLLYFNDRDAFPVDRLTNLFLFIILFETSLGVIQFLSPSESLINKYVRDMSDYGGIATIHAINRVRVTGTFSYIGGMTSLFTLIGFWIWGLRLKGGSVLPIGLLLICAIVTTPMTGARSLSALLIILITIAFVSTFKNVINSLGLVALLFFASITIQFLDVSILNESYAGLASRIVGHTDDGENEKRAFGQLNEIIDFTGEYPLFGTGLGTTYQGAVSLFGQSDALKEYGYYEEEPERIILEGGYVLFFVKLFLWLLVFRLSRIPLLYGILLTILHVFYLVTVYNVFTAFYEFLGIIYVDYSYHTYRPQSR